jgi:thioredoxin-dependent peroxiredoxin
MSRTLLLALAPAALLAVAPAAGAQAPAVPTAATSAPAAPDIGQPAPDFTAPWADGAGARATPVRLADLRGKVVVLAFYPKDRTQGCTAEMTKFRDEHASLFGGGQDVVVLPISADSIPSHVSWAGEMKFPFALVSDPSFTVADQYGSHAPGRATTGRTVFVIGKDGRIAWREMRFNALSEDAYSALKDAVAKAR